MRRTRGLGLAAVAAAAALVVATPAHGETTYDFSFGEPGTGAGQFDNPHGVALNYATGDVYVADTSNNRIQQFDEDGNFIRMWGESVNQTTPGNFCPINPGDVCKKGVVGPIGGAFTGPRGIAVDNSGGPATGSVYVQDVGANRVQRFSASGVFERMWGKEVNFTTGGDLCTATSGDTCAFGEPASGEPHPPGHFSEFGSVVNVGALGPSLAVDGSGNVYVGDPSAEPYPRVQKFDADGGFLGQIASRDERNSSDGVPSTDGNAGGIGVLMGLAVDQAGRAYVINQSVVYRYGAGEFTSTGETAFYEAAFDYTPRNTLGVNGPRAVAIDPSNGYVITVGDYTPHCPDGPSAVRIREFHPGGQEVDCTSSAPVPGEVSTVKGALISPDHRLYFAELETDRVHVFDTPVAAPPTVDSGPVGEITSQSARVDAQVSGNLDPTSFHLEYGASGPCSANPCASTEPQDVGASFFPALAIAQLTGLQPDTTYHYRGVATNSEGTTFGADREFTTFGAPVFDTSCPNQLARQQTRAALLLDCRAYELVSAEDQGGYNVVSDLLPGQAPFAGFPWASDKALYAVKDGGVPGTGKPTNRGPDPYVARRDAANERWVTEYVGIPADAPSTEPFSSTLAEADAGLRNFAFGGTEICDPCFEDGSSGMPLRQGADGPLEQGMAGSLEVADPEPAGGVAKHFSEDGSHFIFASMQKFEPAGNDETGDVTIYDRDLKAGTTQVVSLMPNGETMQAGEDLVALDVSADGKRIVIGKRISTDAEGNDRYHLYMHNGEAPNTIDLTPTTAEGVAYAGMTKDGAQVFFTTPEDVLSEEADTSADLFRTNVSPAGTASWERVSTGEGGTGDTDACDPAANSYNPKDWNVIPGGPTDCSVVAIGGGGGVASGSGAVYFLSPETLDGEGTEGAPNLFVAEPEAAPQFVVTLESSANEPLGEGAHLFEQALEPFVDPSGAAIDSATGDIYVMALNGALFSPGYVQKFDPAGAPDEEFGTESKLAQPSQALSDGSIFGLPSWGPTSIAVDNGPASANYRDLYVPDFGAGVVRRFTPTGASDGTVGPLPFPNFPVSVAVHPTNGNVFVGSYSLFGGGSVFVFKPNGEFVTSFAVSGSGATGVAVDSANNVYVATVAAVQKYNGASGASLGEVDGGPGYGVTVDVADDHVYVDRGNEVVEYEAGGAEAVATFASEEISGSFSLAADSGRVVVSNDGGGNALVFGPALTPPNRAYDSPLVIGSVRSAAASRGAQFQVTPSGDHATFATTLPLTGFDSAGKHELFRYEAPSSETDCLSCNPTRQPPSSDAALAANGLSITDDGRVFFDTREQLVQRDANSRRDAYEWSEGSVSLISTGQSEFDSGLLTVSADGTDAFFFTRETLAKNDSNGTLMKLYTAREGGGFFQIPPPPLCAASDECHGPGSQAAPPVELGTLQGRGGNVAAAPSCSARKLSRRTKRLSRRAKALRRRARKAKGKRAAKLKTRARRKARAAKRSAQATRRCRKRLRSAR